MIKRLFSHTAIYGLAPHIPKLASVFVLPIITRDLTSEDYGIFGLILAYTSAFEVLKQLGLRVVFVNSFFKHSNHFKWIWRQLFGFISSWLFVFAILISVLLYFIIPESEADKSYLIIFLSVIPIVLLGATGTIGPLFYQLKQKPLQIGIRTAIFGTLTVILNLYTISYLKLGYMGWFWSIFIVTILTNLSYVYPIMIKEKITPIYKLKWRSIKRHLKISLPLIPHYYSGYLLESSDRIVMDFLKVGTGPIGKYSFTTTFGGYFNTIVTAAGQAIGPLLNQCYVDKNENRARNLIFLLQGTCLIASFIIAIWLKEIFQILVSNYELSQTYPLAIILLMSYNYRPMYFGANNRLMFYEKTNLLFRVSFVAGFINVVLNFALIPFFGFEVAALTTFAAYLYMGYSGYFFKSFRETCTLNYYPVIWLILSIAALISAYFAVEFSPLYKLVITLIAAIFGFIFIKRLNEN